MTRVSTAAPLVLREDRDDVALRAYPRLAVGTTGLCLVIVVAASVLAGEMAPVWSWPLVGAVGLLSMAARGDVIALQFGRPVVYVLHEDRFEAYRGDRLVDAFLYADVDEWWAAYGASTLAYWVGRGYTRNGWPVPGLSKLRFDVTTESGRSRHISPPALFRWEDRGGLDDVTHALTERIGPPRNR